MRTCALQSLYGGALFSPCNALGLSVTLSNSTFEGNCARRGGAAMLRSSAYLSAEHVVWRDNRASSAGGALSVEEVAFARVTASQFINNTASTGTGGAVVVSGVNLAPRFATLRLVGVALANNSAGDGGGACAVDSDSLLALTNCVLTGNVAGLRGGAIMQTGAGALLNVTSSVFTSNSVAAGTVGAGGGLWTDYWARVSLFNGSFVRNTAVIGSTAWARHDDSLGRQGLRCVNCAAATGHPIANFTVATQSWSAAIVSQPPARYQYGSGVPIADPASRVRVSINDASGNRALADSRSTCSVQCDARQAIVVGDGVSGVSASGGVVDFSVLTVFGAPGATGSCAVRCVLHDGVEPHRGAYTAGALNFTIAACQPGYSMGSARVCVACEASTYSPSGISCAPCPDSATCAQPDPADASRLVGVAAPATTDGYWVAPVSKAITTASCPSFHADSGSCGPAQYVAVLRDGSKTCVTDYTRYSASIVYGCTERYQLYACPAGASACRGGITARNLTDAGGTDVACTKGYTGVLCGVCMTGFVRRFDSTCDACPSGFDAPLATYVVALIFAVALGVAILIVLTYGSDKIIEFFRVLVKTGVVRRVRRACLRKTGAGKPKMPVVQEVQGIQRSNLIITTLLASARTVGVEKMKMAISFAQVRAAVS